MTYYQVQQLSGNGNFDHVLVLPSQDEGIARSILREGAVLGKAYFAESSNIDVHPS